jgi:hypothetical protein
MAAAALSQTRVANTFIDERALDAPINPLARYRTEPKTTATEKDKLFVSAPKSRTVVANTAQQEARATIATDASDVATLQPQGSKVVNAVVREIMRDSVRIECVMPGRNIELQLPPSLFSEELMQPGQPIALSLDTEGGYRRPVVRARQPSPQPNLPGQEEFERWADSL